MTRRLARVVAVALVCAFASTPAFARSHHANHHYRHSASTTHHKRVAHRRSRQHRYHVAQWRQAPQPGSYGLVSAARASIGDTAYQLGVRRTLWCMAAVNKWLERTGHRPSGSDLAKSALSLGPHVREPQVGTLAVMRRRGGGHVGVVSGIDANGNPIVISGNHGHRVMESVYPRERIIAYVIPR